MYDCHAIGGVTSIGYGGMIWINSAAHTKSLLWSPRASLLAASGVVAILGSLHYLPVSLRSRVDHIRYIGHGSLIAASRPRGDDAAPVTTWWNQRHRWHHSMHIAAMSRPGVNLTHSSAVMNEEAQCNQETLELAAMSDDLEILDSMEIRARPAVKLAMTSPSMHQQLLVNRHGSYITVKFGGSTNIQVTQLKQISLQFACT